MDEGDEDLTAAADSTTVLHGSWAGPHSAIGAVAAAAVVGRHFLLFVECMCVCVCVCWEEWCCFPLKALAGGEARRGLELTREHAKAMSQNPETTFKSKQNIVRKGQDQYAMG